MQVAPLDTHIGDFIKCMLQIIKTLLIVKTFLPHNFNHKVYPLDNAVFSTFTHHKNGQI